MTTASADPRTFYTERVPAQWNRSFDAQVRAAESDEAQRSVLEDMQRVTASICVIVENDGAASHRYQLNVAEGRMSAGEEPTRPPFLTLVHDLETFATLERESGDSVLGFLGTLAGQGGDMKLTSTRMQNLHGLSGSACLELTGGAPMTLVARFGDAPATDAPSCTLRIASETFAALKAGELQPQDAFMGGHIDIEGDMQLAMQLALAALSPD